MRIAVGMSGGIDSSVAAKLLIEQGHDVFGITMSIWNRDGDARVKKSACYGPDEKEDIAEAKRICGILGIEHHVIDCSSEYEDEVLSYFREEYLLGRTPNPCVVCNSRVKFGVLLDNARRSGLDFDKFATGHYAKVEFSQDTGRYLLKKCADLRKDQTYFLHRMNQSQLSQAIFPLSDCTKDEVREIARTFDSKLVSKAESQDFYSGDISDLINSPESAGDVVDSSGKVVGSHSGIWNYTVGQRRGLNVQSRKPLYVLKIDRENNRIVVGGREKLFSSSFTVRRVNFISGISDSSVADVKVKMRSMQSEVDARLVYLSDSIRVELALPSDTIAPGQSAVFYLCDEVLGGGVIDEVL